MVDDYRDTYDIRVAEDKVMEKNFRKEFPDVNAAIVDQLARVYRRRPRLVFVCLFACLFFWHCIPTGCFLPIGHLLF